MADDPRRRHRNGPPRPHVAARLAVVLGCAAIAVTAGAEPGPQAPRLEAAADGATGVLSIANALEGQAILSAHSMRPGASATGTVTIRNTGSEPAAFSLSKSDLTDVPGVGGGALSSRLQLQVDDVTTGPPQPIYAGTLAAMGDLELPGPVSAEAERSYRFTVLFPDGGEPSSPTAGDNAYRLASTSVQLDWGANPYEDPALTPPDSPPADVTAPVVRFGRASLRRRKLAVTIASSEASQVSARAKLYGTRVLRRIKLRRVSRSLPAGSATRLVIKLSKPAATGLRAGLAARKPVGVVVAVTATDKAANTRRTSRRIQLRR